MWDAESFVVAGECYPFVTRWSSIFSGAKPGNLHRPRVMSEMFRLCSKKCCETLVFLKEVCIKQTAGFLDANRTCKTAKLLSSVCPERAVG